MRPFKVRMVIAGFVFFLAGVFFSFNPQAQTAPDPTQRFEKTEFMIPMRDGVRLNTAIYTPKEISGPLPILFLRTPYGIEEAPRIQLAKYLKELADDGYIFAFQDIRGRFKSEGQFVMNRPPHVSPQTIDESTDAYDSIDWMIKNVPHNNGRVGMLGVSYGGWLTAMAILDPHPALKAISPQASPADMFLGDDFHHNGAFRLSYGFEYAAMMETSKTTVRFKFDRYDTFEWYLHLGPLSNANREYFHDTLPTWNDFVHHPNYDQFWQRQTITSYLKNPTVPTLNVAGWWDQEDFYGPIRIYEALEKHDTSHMNFLVVGPWNHGGWSRDGHSLGNIDFGSDTSLYFREKIQAPWFAYWLKDKGSLPLQEAVTYRTGADEWVLNNQWPPQENIAKKKLYFRRDYGLAFDPPQSSTPDDFDSYISDPANPVPYRHRPISPTYPGPGWPTWLVEDQRFVHLRPDTLTYESAVLDHDVVVAGDVVAHLYAATSGSDCDWIVKLIDVYPEDFPKDPKLGGYQLMIADEVFRARFRKSFEKPEPVEPNAVNAYVIDLHTNNHAFMKGHRIMVQIQSTWFPIIDRNPQRYVPNIFQATEEDFQKATQKIYRSKGQASYVELPVVTQ